jgi:hypothetical protein
VGHGLVEGGQVMVGQRDNAAFRRAGRDLAEQLGKRRAPEAELQTVDVGP